MKKLLNKKNKPVTLFQLQKTSFLKIKHIFLLWFYTIHLWNVFGVWMRFCIWQKNTMGWNTRNELIILRINSINYSSNFEKYILLSNTSFRERKTIFSTKMFGLIHFPRILCFSGVFFPLIESLKEISIT